ncbi:PREDICTED: exocyst complex component EXO70B1-like [Camelina sativa]|uniref:Exocyst subunit Exo70 family protein n=1 Tax=Camelina sativa TaxID=90675 RepID=A0ABM0WET5_CAMSA|nr:PREDICTED: exocyst complex component EXO70B1-like [Camelina sativa]
MVLFALSATTSSSSSSSKLKKQHPHQSLSESLMEHSIQDAEAIINRWISPQVLLTSSSYCSISSLFSSKKNREEAKRFIDAVHTLHSGMMRLISVNPTSTKLIQAENLMRISMTHLSKEFYRILKSNRRYLDPESVSNRSSSRAPESDSKTMGDLKMISDCMTSSGYAQECFKTYIKIRKSIIVDALNQLGFENLTLYQIQRLEWEVLEKKIRKWIRITTRAVNTLFYGERILSDHVFSSSSSSIRESSFAEITLQTGLALFSLPEKMAKCNKKSPEKIFLTLDVYETVTELLPKIDELFSSDSTSLLKSQVDLSLSNLRDGVVSMIDGFESWISKESSRYLISGGGIHQLTRYVMSFIVFLADYSELLPDIIVTKSLPSPGEEESSGDSDPVKSRIAWLILFLLCKIDAKSRLYNDVALSYLFLINNLNYVLVKVRSSNLKVVLSEDWVEKHEAKVKKYVAKFEEIVWGETMASLNSDDDGFEVTAEERIKRFSDGFEVAYKRQTGWVVPDSKLRDEIKRSVGMMIIPRYSGFCERNRVGLWENVGFDPEDIGNYLSDLYFGSHGSGSVSSIHSSGSY